MLVIETISMNVCCTCFMGHSSCSHGLCAKCCFLRPLLSQLSQPSLFRYPARTSRSIILNLSRYPSLMLLTSPALFPLSRPSPVSNFTYLYQFHCSTFGFISKYFQRWHNATSTLRPSESTKHGRLLLLLLASSLPRGPTLSGHCV